MRCSKNNNKLHYTQIHVNCLRPCLDENHQQERKDETPTTLHLGISKILQPNACRTHTKLVVNYIPYYCILFTKINYSTKVSNQLMLSFYFEKLEEGFKSNFKTRKQLGVGRGAGTGEKFLHFY